MLAGGWFDPRDAELTAIRDNATRLMHRLNVELCGHDDAYRAALRELCPGLRRIHPRTVPLRLRTEHLNRRRVVRQFRLRVPRPGTDPHRPPHAHRPQSAAAHRPASVRRDTAPHWTRSGPSDHRRRRLLAGRRGDRLPGRRHRRPFGHRRRSRRDARHPGRTRWPWETRRA